MKHLKQITFFLIIAFAFSLGNCEDKIVTEVSYIANVPVYKSRKELKAAIKTIEPQKVAKAGKIYIKDSYLFVNEVNKGIHVFDNSNPASPKAIAFLNIPGNVDMAIKGDILYADSYIDLLALDISDLNNPREIARINNAFRNAYPQHNIKYPTTGIDPRKGIVVCWKTEEVVRNVQEQTNQKQLREEKVMSLNDGAKSNRGSSSKSVGIAGSMARFALAGDVLYAINDRSNLQVFNISGNKIVEKNKVGIGVGIETLFIYNKNLFIGSTRGMYIYDISNTEAPSYTSKYLHITACDPVVVNGKYAFVTLRTGTNCGGSSNQLDIISLENIKKPVLARSYNLVNPHGLGIDDNILFICDGKDGLKIYDASDVFKITDNMLAHFENIKTYDVIPYNKILITTGDEGIFQYDYSDIKNIKEISRIIISE